MGTQGMTGWKPIPLVIIAIVFIASSIWIVRDGGGQYLLNTILLGLATSAISIPLGAATAWAAFTSRGILRTTLVLTILAAALIPFYLHVNAWDSLIGRLSWILTTQGKTLTPILDGWSATIWIHAMAATPWVALMFVLRMVLNDSVGEEQALLDTGAWNVFFRLSIRKYLPIAIVAMLWNLTMVSREIAATNIYKVRTLTEDVYLRFNLGEFDPWNQQADNPWIAMAMQIACLSSFVFAGIWISWHAFPWSRLSEQISKRHFRASMRWMRIGVFVLFTVTVVIGPLVSMVIRAGMGVEQVGGKPVADYSFQRLIEVVGKTPFEYAGEYAWTFAIGAASATMVSVAAIICAVYARRSRITLYICTIVAAIFVATPGPIISLTLFLLTIGAESDFVRWWCDRTVALPQIAVSVVAWPWAFFVSVVIWQRIGQDELDAIALDTSGSRWFFMQFNFRNLSIFVVVWLVAFSLAIGDLAASFFVLPPGVDTLARRTFGLLHSGVNNETAALGICNFIFVLFTAGTLYAFGRKTLRR